MRNLVFGIATVVLANVIQAGTITSFTDRPTFDGVVGPTTTETFPSNDPSGCFPLTAPLNSSSSYSCLPAGTILPGATYSAPIVAGNSFNIDVGPSLFPSPFLDSLLLGRGSAPLTVTFDTPISALGFDTDVQTMGSSFTILFNFTAGSSILTPNLASNSSPQFFGFQSSAADIQSVVITGTDSTNIFGFGLDNFSFTGNANSSVPEPTTFPLISAALAFFVGVRKFARSRH